jgi:dolichol-phosphate mannosyltransferase
VELNSEDCLISVVSPVFNEEQGLEAFVHEVTAQLCLSEKFELILVDDGSSDHSWEEIKKASNQFTNVRGIRLTRNFGHQFAVLAGLEAAKGCKIAIIDSDLQDPPALIATMASLISEDTDIVYGKREEREGESFFKIISAKFFYRILNRLSAFEIPLDTGDFRVISRRACNEVVAMSEHDPFLRGLFAFTGYNSIPYRYKRNPRFAGETKYTFLKMRKLATSAFIGFSDAPYKLFVRLGIWSFGIAILFSVYALFHALTTDASSGWISIFAAVVFFGSLNTLFIGLVAKYLMITLSNVRNRPRWIIKETTII